MLSRKKEIKKAVIEFVLFSIFSILLLLTLFHIAILGFPIVGFVWTFFWFTVFQATTLIQIKTRYKIWTAGLVLLYGYVAISLLFCWSYPDKKLEEGAGKILAIDAFVLVGLIVATVLLIKRLITEYLPQVKERIRNARSAITE